MPKNPTDYTVEMMPDWLLASAGRLQTLRSKMDMVNLSTRSRYDDSDMEQIDDFAEQLTKMARRFAELNAAVATEDRRYIEERRLARLAASPTRERSA